MPEMWRLRRTRVPSFNQRVYQSFRELRARRVEPGQKIIAR